MNEQLSLVYISSNFCKGMRVNTPLTFEHTFVTGGWRLFSVLKSSHILLLGWASGCDISGTTTTVLTHGETILTIMLAFSTNFNFLYPCNMF